MCRREQVRGSLTGPTEHDFELLSDGRIIAVWRMGAGDGCGSHIFDTAWCTAHGGYRLLQISPSVLL